MALEKRNDIAGIKSFGLEIDSVFEDYRLILGEKAYHINAPLSTTLNLWGLTLSHYDMDLLIGRTKDPTSLLPPTFKENNYTFGFRLRRNLSYRIPLEFYFLKKSDNHSTGSRVLNSNSFGTNTEIKLGENLLFSSQAWGSLSDLGFGSSFAIRGSYTSQRYGGHAFFRGIFDNYVNPENLLVQSGNWCALNFYERPSSWLGFSQDITYSSFYDMGFGSNVALTRAPLPGLAYGIYFSKRTELISQSIHSEWWYKKFNITGNYNWSKEKNEYGIKMSQSIKNFQIWSSGQWRDSEIFQFGILLPIHKKVRLKSFLNITKQKIYTYHSTGTQLGLDLIKNLSIQGTYEFIHHNSTDDHLVSLSLSNRVQFDQVGFGFIAGRVFMDINNNGRYDVDDQAIADIEVIIDGKEVAKTDKNGNYLFGFVRNGEHDIGLNLGSIPAEMGTEKRRYVVNTKFLSKARLDFPVAELGTIEGIIFYDDNKNGIWDKGEKGVPNVVLGLNGFLTTSNSEGKFRFTNLSSGTYCLEVRILPPETILPMPEPTYIYIKPGQKISDYEIGILKKERPVKKKVFEEPALKGE